MKPLALACVLVFAPVFVPVAAAEAPVLTAHGRVDASHLSLLASPQGLGAGFLLASAPMPDTRPLAFGGEFFVRPTAGVVELRGAAQWQLTSGAGAFQASAQFGLTASGVVRGPVDGGLGPHAGLFVGLGGARLEGVLGAQAGLEAFLRTGGPRVPLRLVLGGRARLGAVGLALTGRAGVDVEGGLSPTWRGELLVSLDWYGTRGSEVPTEEKKGDLL